MCFWVPIILMRNNIYLLIKALKNKIDALRFRISWFTAQVEEIIHSSSEVLCFGGL